MLESSLFLPDDDFESRPLKSNRNGLNLVLFIEKADNLQKPDVSISTANPTFCITSHYIEPHVSPLHVAYRLPEKTKKSVIIRSCTQHEQTKVVTNLPDHIQTLPAVKKFIQTEEFRTLMNSHIIMVNKRNPFGATFKPEPATVEDGTLEPAYLINRAWFDAVAYAYEIYALGLASKPIWPGIYLLKKEVSKKTKLMEFTYAVNSTVYHNALLNALALCKKNGEDAVGVRFADSVCAENMSRNPSNYQVITVTKPIQNHPLF